MVKISDAKTFFVTSSEGCLRYAFDGMMRNGGVIQKTKGTRSNILINGIRNLVLLSGLGRQPFFASLFQKLAIQN